MLPLPRARPHQLGESHASGKGYFVGRRLNIGRSSGEALMGRTLLAIVGLVALFREHLAPRPLPRIQLIP